MTARDLPRLAAILLLGAGDIAIGWARASDPHTHSYGYSHVHGSLTMWGLTFTAVGCLIIAGAFNRWLLWAAAAASIPAWLIWWDFLYQARVAYPHLVPRSGPVTALVIASWHSLLMPYRRRAWHPTAPFRRRRSSSGPT